MSSFYSAVWTETPWTLWIKEKDKTKRCPGGQRIEWDREKQRHTKKLAKKGGENRGQN